MAPKLQIAIVGPCGSGKSTLASSLRKCGINARQIVQEHSYVPNMWQRMSRPEMLVFLDASYEVCTQRKELNWLPAEYAEQQHRLAYARDNCDLYLNTDSLTAKQVVEKVIDTLNL